MIKKLLCWLGIHNWSKNINDTSGQIRNEIAECKRCNERKWLLRDVLR